MTITCSIDTAISYSGIAFLSSDKLLIITDEDIGFNPKTKSMFNKHWQQQ